MSTSPCQSCGELHSPHAHFCEQCGQAFPSATDASTAFVAHTEVFLSYARKDKAFAQMLVDVLETNNRSVWVDWSDIPPTTDWQEEIYQGIEAASSFVFILSPDSIHSEPCLKELEHALQAAKRVIPLVYRKVDPQDIPQALQSLQWIFFTQGELFDISCRNLFFALDTDLDYWHQSVRLLISARHWEEHGKERSRALRGKELREAERWLFEGAKKVPHPGPPVTNFIAASRKQRFQARAIVLTLLMAFLLTAGSAAYFFELRAPDPTLVTTTKSDGIGSLPWAIANAPTGSTITFAAGVRGSIHLLAALRFDSNLVIRGPGAAQLAIIASSALVVENRATVTLANMTFHVAIINEGTLTLTNCIFSDISTMREVNINGGAIYNSDGKLTLISSVVSDNTAIDGDGGGIYNNDGTLRLISSTVSHNSATFFGGGIFNQGPLTLIDSTVSGNTLSTGGPDLDIYTTTTVTLVNSTVPNCFNC